MPTENELKQGRNIYLYYWSIVALAAFTLLNYFSKNFRIEALDIGLMISVVSFLFGFLITITFSMLISKISYLKEALATETGRLASLFLISKQIGKNFHEKIKNRIDEYTISTLRNYTSYEVSRPHIYGIYEDFETAEIKTKNEEALGNSFLYILGELEPIREKLEYLTSRRIEWSLKFSNYVLGIILIVLLFLNRGDTFTNMLFIVLSTVIIFIFLIIEDYDNLRIGDYMNNISNSEQIFDLIERERYYPSNILSRVKLEQGKKYRIGFYDAKENKERIFEITFNKQFDSKMSMILSKFVRK